MSNLAIKMTGVKTAQITFSANLENGVWVAGDHIQHTINITDEQFLRRIQGELFKLKESNKDFNVTLKIGDSRRMTLASSLWHDLNDALLAFIFSMHVDEILAA